MGKINKQVEKWMTKATFDALDKSTIPVGTEINVVGDIEESDLSVELQNKINASGGQGGHCFKLMYDGGMGSGKHTFFWHSQSEVIGDICEELIAEKVIVGSCWFEDTNTFGYSALCINSLSRVINTELSFSGVDLISVVPNENNANPTLGNQALSISNGTITVEQLY